MCQLMSKSSKRNLTLLFLIHPHTPVPTLSERFITRGGGKPLPPFWNEAAWAIRKDKFLLFLLDLDAFLANFASLPLSFDRLLARPITGFTEGVILKSTIVICKAKNQHNATPIVEPSFNFVEFQSKTI